MARHRRHPPVHGADLDAAHLSETRSRWTCQPSWTRPVARLGCSRSRPIGHENPRSRLTHVERTGPHSSAVWRTWTIEPRTRHHRPARTVTAPDNVVGLS